MTKLILVLDLTQEVAGQPLPIDPADMAVRLLGPHHAAGHSVKVESATYNEPAKFMRPKDHEARIKVAEEASQWYLGSPGYAATIFTAYENPEQTKANLKAEMED